MLIHRLDLVEIKPSLKAILVGLAFLGIGNAFTNILVPTRAVYLDFDSIAIGILISLYYSGYLFGCILMPKIVKRVGHIRAFILGAAVLGIATLGYSLSNSSYMWAVFRFFSGSCMAGIYMITESWVNEAADDTNRGRTISRYRIVDLSAVVCGQLLIGVFNFESPNSFVLANIFMTMGLIPLAFTISPSPQPIRAVKVDFAKAFKSSRIATLTTFIAGMAFGSFFGLGPVFASEIGYDAQFIGVFAAAALVGGIVFQVIVGRIADKYDREWFLAVLSLGSAFFAFGIGLASTNEVILIPLVAMWGGFASPVYSMAVAIANDRSKSEDFLEISGSLLLIYSLGAVVGPNIGSYTMAQTKPSYLFYFLGVSFLLLVLYIALRKMQATRPKMNADIDDFISVPRTTPSVFILDPRADLDDVE